MRIIFIVCLLLITQPAISKMKVTGKICGTKYSSTSNIDAYMSPDKYHFPLNHYKVTGFFICDLEYQNKVAEKDRKLDLKIYKTIFAEGELNLTSQDRNGNFKYFLSMYPVNINNDIADGLYKSIVINGSIIFTGKQKSIPLEGSVTFKNKKPILSSSEKNNNYFTLKLVSPPSFNMLLTRLKDIPVTVEFDTDNLKNTRSKH